ncbi:MAG: septum formation initiator family protein [Weeksellaceae bacterium]
MKNQQEEEKRSGRWYRFFLNKYLIVFVLFLVWMVFFDQNSYFIHRDLDKEIKELTQQEKYYKEKLEQENEQILKMKTDPDALEKIAREKHYLRKENEDVFIVEERKVKKIETDSTNLNTADTIQ